MPRCAPSGPCPARIAIVGEAPGQQEELLGVPFIGQSGQELTRMLADAGINRRDCFLTNVFQTRPPSNKIDAWFGSKKECGNGYTLPPVRTGKYVLPQHLIDGGFTIHQRLALELSQCAPNIVIALGAIASWALLGTAGIKNIRGTTVASSLVPGLKCLPTYHPAYVLRDWTERTTTVLDLIKAERESHFPSVVRPKRTVWIEPAIHDLDEWVCAFERADILTYDIETGNKMIKCVGIGTDAHTAYVIPFVDMNKPTGSYWTSAADEKYAWRVVRYALNLAQPKLAQNGLYDLQYLWRAGIPVRNATLDTMLAHHAIQLELKKDLGFMGSIYTNESSWKLLRKRSGDEPEKKDE